eukprot:EG_transcript_51669
MDKKSIDSPISPQKGISAWSLSSSELTVFFAYFGTCKKSQQLGPSEAVDKHGEVCPANWTPGASTMKADPHTGLPCTLSSEEQPCLQGSQEFFSKTYKN